MRISDWSSGVCSSAFPPVVRAGVYSTGTDRTNSPLRALLRSLSHLTSRLFHPSRARLEGRHPTTPVVRPWKPCLAERPHVAPPGTEIGRAACRERVGQYV